MSAITYPADSAYVIPANSASVSTQAPNTEAGESSVEVTVSPGIIGASSSVLPPVSDGSSSGAARDTGSALKQMIALLQNAEDGTSDSTSTTSDLLHKLMQMLEGKSGTSTDEASADSDTSVALMTMVKLLQSIAMANASDEEKSNIEIDTDDLLNSLMEIIKQKQNAAQNAASALSAALNADNGSLISGDSLRPLEA